MQLKYLPCFQLFWNNEKKKLYGSLVLLVTVFFVEMLNKVKVFFWAISTSYNFLYIFFTKESVTWIISSNCQCFQVVLHFLNNLKCWYFVIVLISYVDRHTGTLFNSKLKLSFRVHLASVYFTTVAHSQGSTSIPFSSTTIRYKWTFFMGR